MNNSCMPAPTHKKEYITECCGANVTRNKWTIDDEIPIFTKDRDYIEKYI